MSSGATALPELDRTNLGQVFTPDSIVETMLGLRQRMGSVLEPSAGDGAFWRRLPGALGVELDDRVARPGMSVMDFFALPVSLRFDTIIGNPPYVRHQDITVETKALLDMTLFDRRSNLYLFFIARCIEMLAPGGELIFIVPRDFAKLTSAARLNAWMADKGTITHWMEAGDMPIFRGVAPNCAIFRFELGNRSARTWVQTLGEANGSARPYSVVNGQMRFERLEDTIALSDLFDVRVGAVSGADALFSHPQGNAEFVCSHTLDTGCTRRMIYNTPHPALLEHKAALLARAVRRFDESNWWQWGRAYPESDAPRVYVNGRTRRARPFFTHPACAFDGAILALFPKHDGINVARAADALNRVDWAAEGFRVGGRLVFTQRALQCARLPRALTDTLFQ